MKKLSFVFIAFSALLAARGQYEKKELFPPPNTANFMLHGQIPVDLFTGLARVNVPMFNFTSRDLAVPVSLNYHVASVKPSTVPGWVGLGWSLDAGGVITRTLNDLPDEYINYANGISNPIYRGFFHNNIYNSLAAPDWASANKLLQEHATYFGNPNDPNRKDKAPDEFNFNFLGMSGTLAMGQDGQWKLSSRQGQHFKVSVELGEYRIQYPGNPYYSIIKSCIKSITLTGPNGTKYTFGGTPNSVEFNRYGVGLGIYSGRDGGTVPTSWYLTEIKSHTGDEITLEYVRDGYQIVSSCGSFGSEYRVITSAGPISPTTATSGAIISDVVYILDPVRLTRITGSNGYIDFTTSNANIRDYYLLGSYFFIPNNWTQLKEAYHYEVFNNSTNLPASTYKKLDAVTLKNNSHEVIKSFELTYEQSSTNRLFLSSVKEKGINGEELPTYEFTYFNTAGLDNVPYATLKVDHWGYYNGVDPVLGLLPIIPPPPPIHQKWHASATGGNYMTQLTPTMASTYFNRRQPVEAAMKAGILTKVKYPTGGNTEFIYEPHNFSKALTGLPETPAIDDLGVNKPGGGLRIKKIISSDGTNGPPLVREYFYVRDYLNNGTLSSGVLNSAEPKYVEEDTYTEVNQNGIVTFQMAYRTWSSQNLMPSHYTNGGHITYTDVTELNADGSFTVYNYSNHDNGHLNRAPVASLINTASINEYAYLRTSNIEIERGQLQTEKKYRNDKLLLSEKVYEYNDDAARFNNSIRKYTMSFKQIFDGQQFAGGEYGIAALLFQRFLTNIQALEIYIHYPHVKKITETAYDQNGSNPLTNVTNFAYDAYRNVTTETVTTSKGEQLVHTYKYPPNTDITGLTPNALAAKNSMVQDNIVNTVLDKLVTRNAVQITQERTNFKVFENSSIFNVAANRETSTRTNALENEVDYINFDSKGNILQFNNRNNIPNSFQWDYNQAYPTAKVQNAANTFRSFTTYSVATNTNFIIYYPGQFYTQQVSFNHVEAGTISIGMAYGGWPGSTTNPKLLTYTLQGPQSQSGTICLTNTGSGCSSYASSASFSNMPPGQYLLSVTLNSDFGTPGVSVTYSYRALVPSVQTSGITEFYYQGFEEEAAASTVNPHAGKKSYLGDYTVPYMKPNARNYKVNYHYRTAGVWYNITKVYANNMVLSEGDAIDEVRVYPEDAMMHTYTYDPLVGMTSATDQNGTTTTYEYDNLRRLKLLRDKDRNIIKQFDYKYQSEPCSADWQNTTTALRCRQVNGQNTGEQEQEQRDMNPCSASYNNTRWVVTGVNTTACPLPVVYARLTEENHYWGADYHSADIVVRFYSDAAGTVPMSVTNLPVNWAYDYFVNGSFNGTINNQTNSNGTSVVLEYGAILYLEYVDFGYWENRFYYLLPGAGYIIIN